MKWKKLGNAVIATLVKKYTKMYLIQIYFEEDQKGSNGSLKNWKHSLGNLIAVNMKWN